MMPLLKRVAPCPCVITGDLLLLGKNLIERRGNAKQKLNAVDVIVQIVDNQESLCERPE
jgi:hypothetical protein